MGSGRWTKATVATIQRLESTENRYYNGWKGSTFVNSVFVFAPDGCIQICTLNAPGTFHDSTMAEYGIYEKMEGLYNCC